MSRISKLLLSGTAACIIGASAAQAQDTGDSTKVLQSLLDSVREKPSANSDTAATDAVREAIVQAIINIATREDITPNINKDGDLTIEEIDALNRKAERAKANLEMEKTELARKETELKGLLTLHETLRVIEETGVDEELRKRDEMIAEKLEALLDMQRRSIEQAARTQQRAQLPQVDPLSREKAELPRISNIFGATESLEAQVEFPDGTTSYVRGGDLLGHGLEVKDVLTDRVVIKGIESGQEYVLTPRGPDLRETDFKATNPIPAIDMRGFPVGAGVGAVF